MRPIQTGFWAEIKRLARAKRTSLMQLRLRHLDQIDSMARGGADIDDLRDTLCNSYHHFLGDCARKPERCPATSFAKTSSCSRFSTGCVSAVKSSKSWRRIGIASERNLIPIQSAFGRM
jgi:hypothetical protein